jgi:hypothetical protein
MPPGNFDVFAFVIRQLCDPNEYYGARGSRIHAPGPKRPKLLRNLLLAVPYSQWNVVGFLDAPQAKLRLAIPSEFCHPRPLLRMFVVRRPDGGASVAGRLLERFVVPDELRDMPVVPRSGPEPADGPLLVAG